MPKDATQKLGLIAATAVVLGNIVGVMIFLTPAQAAVHLPWDSWYLVAWALGGIIALLGALSLGELGAMMPMAGGDYIYIREAFGERTAFLSGWTSVTITFPGSIAAMAVALCVYQAPALLGDWVRAPMFTASIGALHYTFTWAQLLGISVIVLLTVINHLGLKMTGWLQTAITSTPVLLMLAAGVAALFITTTYISTAVVPAPHQSPLLGLWPAVVPIFFAYAGWNVTTYIGSEIKDPGRNIPRSLIIGTSAAMGVYLIVNWVFLKGVSAAAMPHAGFVPETALSGLFGTWAAQLLVLVIALAVLGSLNATILAGARISYAMAGHGLAFSVLRHRSPRFGTPAAALWLQAGVAIVLVLSGRFDQLVTYVVGVMLVFSSVAVAAVIALRWRLPTMPRPYRTWGYPVTPSLYILFSGAVVVGLCFQSLKEVVWGLLITALGFPLYEWLRWRRGKDQ